MGQHFDLITIGGRSGGVSALRHAAAHGAKVALIEKSHLGGTCVHRGCVPKKLLVYASQFRTSFDDAAAFGWSIADAQFSMNSWQDAKTAELNRLESVYGSLLDDSGVYVIRGTAEIVNSNRVHIGGKEITAERLLIATGSRPAYASIPGLEAALTSDDILNLRVVPKRLAIIDAGYIGIEFGSMFAKLGSQVSVFFGMSTHCGDSTRMCAYA